MNRKQKIVLLVAIVCIIVVIAIIVFNIMAVISLVRTLEGAYHNFPTSSVISSNGQYVLATEVFTEETGTYATFVVKSFFEENVIYECPDCYRVFDLKSIEWDSLDVVVSSGDVGTIKYIYDNGSWKKK